MKITNLKPKWGCVIEATIDEVINESSEFWKDIGYRYDFILFRGFGLISDEQYYNFISKFGLPWTPSQYHYSREHVKLIDNEESDRCLSIINNKNSIIRDFEMPWHADIPNTEESSFPWRSLYIVKNPNPDGGLTTWLNVTLDAIEPTEDDLKQYRSMSVLNQSWWNPGSEIRLQDYIKVDPVSKKESLRSNYFIRKDDTRTRNAWIKETYIDGVLVDNLEVLGPIHKKLSQREDLTYTHRWELYDFIIYNNHSFIHKRTSLELNDSSMVREFIRANINHDY